MSTVGPEGQSRSGGAPTPRAYLATLDSVRERAPGTRSLFLRLAVGQQLDFRPGQFISIAVGVGDREMVRAYSIASDPGTDPLEICLDLVPGGAGSAYLFGLHAGATLRFTGPWGTFVLDRVPEAECVFVAQGTGIAPLRPMIRAALDQAGRSLRLIHAVSDRARLLYRDEFEEWARRCPRLVFEPLIEGNDPATEHGPLRTLIAERYVHGDGDRSRHFYICGIGAVVTDLRNLLRKAGYERGAVHYEKW